MLACINRYNGPTFLTITKSPQANIGVTTTNTIVNSGLIVKVKNNAINNITGARTSGRIPLLIAVCRIVTSLVNRVIKDDVEK